MLVTFVAGVYWFRMVGAFYTGLRNSDEPLFRAAGDPGIASMMRRRLRSQVANLGVLPSGMVCDHRLGLLLGF